MKGLILLTFICLNNLISGISKEISLQRNDTVISIGKNDGQVNANSIVNNSYFYTTVQIVFGNQKNNKTYSPTFEVSKTFDTLDNVLPFGNISISFNYASNNLSDSLMKLQKRLEQYKLQVDSLEKERFDSIKIKQAKLEILKGEKIISSSIDLAKQYGVEPTNKYNIPLDEIRKNPRVILLEDFSEGYALFKFDNKYGYLNKNGKLVKKLGHDYYYAESFSCGLALVQDKKDGDYHYIDKEGKYQFAIPKEYKRATSFCDNVAAVQLYRPRGGYSPFSFLINTKGIPTFFKTKTKYFDPNFETLYCNVKRVIFTTNITSVRKQKGVWVENSDGTKKWISDFGGHVLNKTGYESIRLFEDKYFLGETGKGENDILDVNGQVLYSISNAIVIKVFSNSVSLITTEKDKQKVGLMDENLLLVPPVFDRVELKSKDLFLVYDGTTIYTIKRDDVGSCIGNCDEYNKVIKEYFGK